MRSNRLAAAAGAATGILAAAWSAWADVPRARIVGVSDGRLRQEIERALGASKNPPQSRIEARRRAEAAALDVMSVLRSEGYYEATATPDVGQGDKPQAVVAVDPGARFSFAEPDIEWIGEAPIPQAQIAGKAAIGLTIGGAGRAADVVNAEGRVLAAVQKRGYADAKADPRQVVVDHIPRTVEPDFRIDAGARVRMDGIKLTGKGRSRASWVSSLLPWKPGDVYDPDQVAELEKRLRDTAVFDSVTVSLDPKPNGAGQRPVDVALIDRPKSSLDLGATYSTADNSGVDVKWTRFNRLGLGDTLTLSAQAANILSQVEAELALPNWLGAPRTLKLSTAVYHDDTNAYLETGFRIGANLQQRFGRADFHTEGLSFVLSRDNEPDVMNGALVHRARPLATVIALGVVSLDRSDDLLNPRRGWRLQLQAEPTVSVGAGSTTYVRGQVQASAYQPFDSAGATVLAGRIHVGDIFLGSIPAVPASRRFYSGGGGSVRGYGYQEVGPRFPNNSPQGGISLVEASVELRRKLFGPIGGVIFVDSGVLGSTQTFKLKAASTGAGVGLRYDLGFAPLRFDIAVPVERRAGDASVQVYISIGQSF